MERECARPLAGRALRTHRTRGAADAFPLQSAVGVGVRACHAFVGGTEDPVVEDDEAVSTKELRRALSDVTDGDENVDPVTARRGELQVSERGVSTIGCHLERSHVETGALQYVVRSRSDVLELAVVRWRGIDEDGEHDA